MLFQFNANQQVQLPPLFRAPTWHFRGVASSLLGPHQTGARVTTLNLTPPTPPNDRPHEPPDPPRDDCASWRFQSGVASSIQGPHPRQLAFPPHPCLAADPTSLPEAKPREQTRSPGAAAAAAVCVILAMSGGPPLLSVWTPDSPSTMMMEEEKEKEVTYCLDQSEGGEGGTKLWRWRKEGGE